MPDIILNILNMMLHKKNLNEHKEQFLFFLTSGINN